MTDTAPETAPNPQQMAAGVISAFFQDDAISLSAADQIAAALSEAGLLIDPVDGAMWANLRDGDMACHYVEGEGLRFTLTEKGENRAKEMLRNAAEPDAPTTE